MAETEAQKVARLKAHLIKKKVEEEKRKRENDPARRMAAALEEAEKNDAAVAEHLKAQREAWEQKWKAQAAAKKREERTAFIKYMRENKLKYEDLDPLEKITYDDLLKAD